MTVVEAAAWGLCGGAAAGLVSLASAIVAADYKWPWKGNDDGPWPRFCVYLVGVIIGVIVTTAAHSEMSGALPALLMGVSAPSVVRGALARVEVSESAQSAQEVKVEVTAGGASGDPA
jgi:hypothetical protein